MNFFSSDIPDLRRELVPGQTKADFQLEVLGEDERSFYSFLLFRRDLFPDRRTMEGGTKHR